MLETMLFEKATGARKRLPMRYQKKAMALLKLTSHLE